MKIITAPECKLPKITFTSFDLWDQTEITENVYGCKYDGLEIRTTDPLIGDWFVFCLSIIS